MAEGLGKALQKLLRGFKSLCHLQIPILQNDPKTKLQKTLGSQNIKQTPYVLRGP